MSRTLSSLAQRGVPVAVARASARLHPRPCWNPHGVGFLRFVGFLGLAGRGMGRLERRFAGLQPRP